MEKIIRPISGFLILLVGLLALTGAVYLLVNSGHAGGSRRAIILMGILLILVSIFFMSGLTIISPNQSKVCTFFGRYVGTIKENGLRYVNPLYSRKRLSLRLNNLESSKLKVNDKMGNPIEIAAVIVWQVKDTYRASFEVTNYEQYIKIQSEAAIRHLAVSYPYDNMENEHASLTLREGGEKVTEMLTAELNERSAEAGIIVKEARISHLAYASEIAGAMLQRQQATAIVAARYKIVEGAVGMVELALEELSKKEIVSLDEERKAAMVSNLMVVLCGEKAATPVLNTGTLYQ
ncbi:SPFH domain-containing protein [Foetidibacter luteolus]|uniref:SPFH domain-containing protein n=1 Tax=Foetidibacter luteolus TaxID=2608880 RepID=UPI00129B3DB9|nr:SPFH domain-containing protein [Foetidibacter luteolus]